MSAYNGLILRIGVLAVFLIGLFEGQSAFGQDRSRWLFFELGRNVTHYSDTRAAGINGFGHMLGSPTLRIGVSFERNGFSHALAAELWGLWPTDPLWVDSNGIEEQITHRISYVGAVDYDMEQKLITSRSGLFFVSVGAGISIGIIPQHKLFSGNDTLGNSFVQHSNAWFESYARMSSPVSIRTNAHCVFGLQTDQVTFSVMPAFNAGIFTIYENRYTYVDNVRGTSGSGRVSSKGTSFGVRLRLAINLEAAADS